MIDLLKRKRVYEAPRTALVSAGEQGLICSSFFISAEVDELHNVNADDDPDEYFDFEF